MDWFLYDRDLRHELNVLTELTALTFIHKVDQVWASLTRPIQNGYLNFYIFNEYLLTKKHQD